ncbi:MAG: SDR family NAD(P)-dependent oxidoreductase [Alphaproteobacteria bacterium]|jgi:NAD(P)-dependent dehydrogenase (short-subunit alcohol dehydrogenase family)
MTNNLFRLDGRAALVTGASRGLGRRFAIALAAAGAHVALAARDEERLAAVAAEITAAGGTAAPVVMDVTDRASVTAGVASAESLYGPLRAVINNSGIAITKRLLDVTADEWDPVIDVNLTGAWMVAQAAAKAMVAHGNGGSIVNISSILGQRTNPGVIAYNAAKAGLDHVTREMAAELAKHGVRVNALAPGYIETDMNRAYWDTPPGKALMSRVPMQRLGQEADLDGPAVFLASDASSYMTGQIIGLDGGHAVGFI